MNRNELAKRVIQAAVELLCEKGYAAPVDLFKKIGMLTEADYEKWRRRQVPYLEKVLIGSLGRCSFVMSRLRGFADAYNLKPSRTAYMSWGRGAKTRLIFSKYRNEEIEKWDSTHFVKVKSWIRVARKAKTISYKSSQICYNKRNSRAVNSAAPECLGVLAVVPLGAPFIFAHFATFRLKLFPYFPQLKQKRQNTVEDIQTPGQVCYVLFGRSQKVRQHGQ